VSYNCTCEEGLVRNDDGICVPPYLCPCYDDDGNEVPEGQTYTRDGDECVTYHCLNGEDQVHRDNRTECPSCASGEVLDTTQVDPDNPCCYKCVIATQCRLHTNRTKIFVRIEGSVCETPEEIDLNYCQGECSGNVTYRGEIYYGGTVIEETSTDCTCCTGIGNLTEYNVTCPGEGTTHPIRLRQMSSCVCEECGYESLAPATTDANSAVDDAQAAGEAALAAVQAG